MRPITPSPPARARPARRRGGWAALGGLLALAAFAVAFDWNWFTPAIRHYVMSHSGRRFDCGDFQVRFHGSLNPTIEMRGLYIQNAPWAASKAPFIRAGYAAATIEWRTIGSGLLALDSIVLRDAQVDMERRADGVRNWRLSRPDDTGPPRVRVLAVDAQRSQLHVVLANAGLVGDGRLDPLPPQPAVPGHADLPLTKRLVFDGSYRGHAFAIDAAVSDVLTFGATPRVFALRGIGRLGGLRLDAEGISNDVHGLGDFSVDAKFATSGGGPLWPLPEALARARPLAARGHVAKTGASWTGTDAHAALGRRTAVAGDVRFVGAVQDPDQRRRLDATLHDAVLDVDDLRALAGRPAAPAASPPAFALSAAPLPLERLRGFDADIDLRDARIVASPGDLVQGLRVHATLAAGQLRASGLDLDAAGGHVTGSLRFDARRAPAELGLDLQAHGLDVARLAPRFAKNDSVSARVDARAQLQARGDSAHALAAAAAGTVDASLEAGASVSKRLDAALSLDGGEWLRTLFDKSARVPVACAALALAVDRGIGTSRRFAFETAHTALAGRGTVDVVGETIDATLTPARKTRALLALDKSIHAHGPWRDVRIALEPPAAGTAPERCAAPSEAAAASRTR